MLIGFKMPGNILSKVEVHLHKNTLTWLSYGIAFVPGIDWHCMATFAIRMQQVHFEESNSEQLRPPTLPFLRQCRLLLQNECLSDPHHF